MALEKTKTSSNYATMIEGYNAALNLLLSKNEGELTISSFLHIAIAKMAKSKILLNEAMGWHGLG